MTHPDVLCLTVPKNIAHPNKCDQHDLEICKEIKKKYKHDYTNSNTLVKTDCDFILLSKLSKKHKIKNKKVETILCDLLCDKLIYFPKNSLGKNIPCKPTYLEPNTILYLDNLCAQAKKFVGRNCIVCKYVYYYKFHYVLLKSSKQHKYLHNNIKIKSYDPKNKLAKKYFKKNGNQKNSLINQKKSQDVLSNILIKFLKWIQNLNLKC